jgi:hypothetical protein
MAARLNPQQDARTRNAIKTSQLVNRLQSFALSDIDPVSKSPVKMDRDQITAALGLLKKTLPDLVATQLSGEVTTTHVVRAPAKPADAAEWAATYAPKEATE